MLIIKQNTQQSVYFEVTRQVSQQVLKSTLAKIYQIQRRKIGTIPHGPFGVCKSLSILQCPTRH